jgi:hypothetical protein
MPQTLPYYWGLREIARYLNVTYNSARTYHGRAEINRKNETPRPGDLPPPDARFGNSPVWNPETVMKWAKHSRPGRGVGGGAAAHRKRRDKNSAQAEPEPAL